MPYSNGLFSICAKIAAHQIDFKRGLDHADLLKKQMQLTSTPSQYFTPM